MTHAIFRAVRRLALCAGACLLQATAGVSQAAPPPAEVFFKDPDIVEAVLSPSGRKLALTTAKGMTRVSLVVLDLGPGGRFTRVAQFADGDVARVQWVNDERLVFSLLDHSEGSGRPNGAPGLFAVNADGEELRALVARQNRPVISRPSINQRLLDWNHFLLKVPAPQAGTPNDEVLVVEVQHDEPHAQHPLWLNTRTGRTRRLDLGDYPDHAIGWLTDSRGEPRVVFTVKGGRRAALWRPPGQTAWTPLYESGQFDAPFSPHSVDDAGTLYITHRRGPEGHAVLSRWNPETRKPDAQPLVAAPGFDFQGNLLALGAGPALGVRLTTDAETTVWFDPEMKKLQQRTDELLPGRVNRITCRRCGQPDMTALVRSFNDRDPGRLWLYQAQPPAGERPWRLIARLREAVVPEQGAPTDLHRIKARDGRDLPVWVTRPTGAPGPWPTVVLVHGGPWVRGGQWQWDGMTQFLASRGYLVVAPEFRGSLGYGAAHFRAGFKQWGRAMQDDVADALLWARSQKLASDQACIAGASYGGYSALMGLVRHPELYRCGVAWVAVADLPLMLEGSWFVSDDTSNLSRQHRLPEMVYDAKTEMDLVLAHSPVHQAAHIKAPLLLAYGSDDQRVPLAHGKRLREALQKAGHEPEWVVYDGEGHGWALLKHRLDFAQRVEQMLARHLRPEPAPSKP
jgi:dipeptidyl aminopeptidase/acylaminoacyl peptidase